MYARLNRYFYQVGYRLPLPENVGQLWLDSFTRTLGRFSNLFVADVGGELAGFALCRLKRVPPYMGGMLVGEISDVWVEPPYRRLGIAAGLTRLALEWLRLQGAHSVEVQVLRDNEGSLHFFEQMGFTLEFRTARLLWEDYTPGREAG